MVITLDNVIAVVTGAAGGLGREICKSLSEAGAIVIATDLAGEAEGIACDTYLQLDVTDAAGWQRVRDEVAGRHGRVDALVHNAGSAIIAKFEDTTLEAFHRLNAVNVDSVIVGTQIMLPLLKKGGQARSGGASVVNLSSAAGMRGAPFNAAYCTSKAAVKMLSKCLGAEFAALSYNIRVNSVHPGGIQTPMLDGIIDRYVELGGASSPENAMEGFKARHPIGRIGRPDEIGGGIVYLCSEAASFVTCSEFLIDGGYTQV